MIYPFADTVRKVMNLLVARKYSEIETLTSGVRLTAKDIAQAIAQYGRTLVEPPKEAYGKLDVVQIHNATRPQWSVRMDLWTEEEGRSDLSVELTLIETSKGYAVELDDIHVL